MYRYKTLLVEGWPDAVLSAAIVEGWELVAVTKGGFDRDGKHHPLASVLWLRRK